MERPKREDFDKICRLCLKSTNLVNIFERNPKTQTESLSTLVRETVEMLGLAIEPVDNFPRKMCLPCKDTLRSLYKFRNQCQEANDLILEALSNFVPEPVVIKQPEEPEQQPKPPQEFVSVKSASMLIKQDTPQVDEERDVDPPTEVHSVLEADSSSALYVSIVKSETPSTQESQDLHEESTVTVTEEYEYLEAESEPEEQVEEEEEEHGNDGDAMEVNTESDVYTIEMQNEEEQEDEDDDDDDAGDEAPEVEVYIGGSCSEEEPSDQQVDMVKQRNVKGQLCKICNKYSTCLKYHMMSHTGERPFSCPHCEKSFRTSTKLNIHINGVHLKLRKFVCTVCNKKFLDAGNLKTHMATHAETKKYVCDYENCGKAFALPGTLRVHKLSHTQDKQFECDFCPKVFLYKWLLVKHLRTHTGEKPYACEICHKKFTTSTHMKTHLKIHDPSRPKTLKGGRKGKQDKS